MNNDEENPLSTPSKDSLEMETSPLTQLPVSQKNHKIRNSICALNIFIFCFMIIMYILCNYI
jgi:hypothetical protein